MSAVAISLKRLEADGMRCEAVQIMAQRRYEAAWRTAGMG